MDTIELWYGDTKALISTEGAWLTNLSDENGDILFPKRQLASPDGDTKTRGGSHVCLPNFGPGGDTELPQHGFGRVASWNIIEKALTGNVVTLQLSGGAPGYEGLVSSLMYALEDHSLTMTLTLQNTSDKSLRVAPAFHPYFALQSDEQQVRLDGETVNLVDIHEMQLQQGVTRELRTKKRLIQITSDQLHMWALWSDQLGNYVCVEPTLKGYAFLEPTTTSEELSAGQTQGYNCQISW